MKKGVRDDNMQSISQIELSVKKRFLTFQFFMAILLVLGVVLIFFLGNSESCQNIAIAVGEKIKYRALNHNHWHRFLGSLNARFLFLFLTSFLFC